MSAICKHRQVPGAKAITLIELLVVSTIISVLAAMLLPVLHRAIEAAREIACMSNQKQIALGMFGHIEDNDDMLPPVVRYDLGTWSKYKDLMWFKMVVNGEYVPQNVFACPTLGQNVVSESFPPQVIGTFDREGLPFSYNHCLGSSSWRSLSLHNVSRPSRTVLIGDSDGTGDHDLRFTGKRQDLTPYKYSDMVGFRHRMGAEITTLDGSCRWFNYFDIALGEPDWQTDWWAYDDYVAKFPSDSYASIDP